MNIKKFLSLLILSIAPPVLLLAQPQNLDNFFDFGLFYLSSRGCLSAVAIQGNAITYLNPPGLPRSADSLPRNDKRSIVKMRIIFDNR